MRKHSADHTSGGRGREVAGRKGYCMPWVNLFYVFAFPRTSFWYLSHLVGLLGHSFSLILLSMSLLLSTTFLDIIVACLALFIVLRLIFPARSDLLPPGPARLPFGLGNILDMPAQQPWQTFADWGDKYGLSCSSERVLTFLLTFH